MMDGMDAWYATKDQRNPFLKFIGKPIEFLNAYMGSKEEKDDAQEMFTMGKKHQPDKTPPMPSLSKISFK